MALTPAFGISSVVKTATGSDTIITDSTTYGGANPARSVVAVAIKAVKIDKDQVETPLTVASYDDETATTFTVTNTYDGWQRFYCSIIDDYDGGTTYNQYDVVHYPSTGLYYRSTSSTPFSGVLPTVTANWSVVTHDQIVAAIGTATESENVLTQIVQTDLSFATTQCLDDIVIALAMENCCDGCSNPQLETKKRKLELLAYAINVASSREMYLQGEKFAREAENYCDNCSC